MVEKDSCLSYAFSLSPNVALHVVWVKQFSLAKHSLLDWPAVDDRVPWNIVRKHHIDGLVQDCSNSRA